MSINSYLVGLDVYLVVRVFIFFFVTLCMPTVHALMRLFLCKDWSEPWLLARADMTDSRICKCIFRQNGENQVIKAI